MLRIKRISRFTFFIMVFILFVINVSSSYASEELGTVSFPKSKIHNECEYHIELEGEDGTIYQATEGQDIYSNPAFNFTVPIEKGDKYYYYKFIPDVENKDDYYGSKGKIWVHQKNVQLSGYNLSDGGSFTVSQYKTVTVDVPEGAVPKYCLRPLFYRYIDKIEGVKTSSAEGFDTYELKVPQQPNAPISYYEVSSPGKVLWAGFLKDMEKISDNHYRMTDTLKNDPKLVTHEGQNFYEAGILLNGPGSKSIELESGEYFDAYAFRTWQPIDSTTGNTYVDPLYHYEVIEGSDSISVDEEGRITANSAGVGIVEVTYDALDYVSANTGERQFYSACWPERAGIYVISVDGLDSSDIITNIALNEYSTVYYAKSIDGVSTGNNSAKYTFKPKSKSGQDITVSVGHPSFSNTDTTYSYSWQEYLADDEGAFTVDLVSGKNIIKVKAGDAVKYQVVAANGTDITTENKYRSGESLEQGDTAIVKFTNIATPIPKLGAIYNPGYPDGHSINYTVEDKQVSTRVGQYTISIDARVELNLDKAGEIEFKDGFLSGEYYGVEGQTHNNMAKGGFIDYKYVEGMDNPSIDMGRQSILPDFTIHVDEQGEAEERAKREAGELKSFSLGHTASNNNLVKLDELKLTKSQNFTYANATASLTFNKAVNIMVEAKNPDSTITVIYNNTNGVSGTKVIQSGESTNLTTAAEAFLAASRTDGNDCFITVNVDPGDKGYPKTYSLNIRPPQGTAKASAIPNFVIEPEEGEFGRNEGVFEAQDVIGDGFNWGKGYVQSLHNYYVTLPARVKGIKVTSALGNATITNEAGVEYEADAVIPINAGDNIITVKRTSSNGNFETTYTFNFKVPPLERAKYDACKELQEYVDAIDKTLYKEAEQEAIDLLLAEGKEAINAAEDEEAVAETLAQAKEKIDAVEKAADIDAAVGPVENAINALPASDALILDDKDDVVAAREMYNALTDTEKGYVSNEMTLKLAEVVIEKLELEKQLTEANNTIDSLTNEKNALLSQLTAAQAQVAALTGEKNTLEEEKAALTDTLNSIREQVNALSGENDTLKSEKAALLSQLDSIQEQVDALTGEKETLEADKAALTEQLNKAIAQVEKLTADNSNLESKLNEAEEKVKEAEKAKAEEDAANADIDSITPSEKVAAAANINSSVLAEINAKDIKATINAKKKSVAIKFKAVKNAVNYRISYRKANAATWSTVWTKGKTSYSLTKLNAKGIYQFKIAAFAKKDGKWIKGDDSVINCSLISKVTIKKVKAGKKAVTVSWKKAKGVSGYQVLYSAKKSMKNAKLKTVKGAKKVKVTVKGLKKGKKVYVQIRPYKTKAGKTYIGAPSAKKSVKVK